MDTRFLCILSTHLLGQQQKSTNFLETHQTTQAWHPTVTLPKIELSNKRVTKEKGNFLMDKNFNSAKSRINRRVIAHA
jgi:hypothetical protein